MSVFLTSVLNACQTYGYPALWGVVFVAALGAPLPTSLMLLAIGAFAAQSDFNFAFTVLIATSASVGGDCSGYLIGRLWGRKVLVWLPSTPLGRRVLTPQSVERSRQAFGRHGGWAVFLTRFLLTPLGAVTNLVAGSEAFSFPAFVGCDVAGELLGAIIPLTLGFAFGASWEAIGDILGSVSLCALGLGCMSLAIYGITRLVRHGRSSQTTQESDSHPQEPALPHTLP